MNTMLDINAAATDDAGFEINYEHKKKGSRQTNDMSHSIDLFRKYLLTKSENHNVGKTNKDEESEVLKKKSPRALIPFVPPPTTFDCNICRPLSLLERNLVPATRSRDTMETSSSAGKSSSKAQLTIFYAGVINVYDNVPIEKAQAIMLLAGESSLSKPISTEKPKTEAKIPLNRPNIESSSSCKLQAAEPPIAQKLSLQHFLEKRRCRIVSNSPYALAANRDAEKENTLESENNKNSDENNHSISLSPFPSRLGYFSSVAANKGCQA